MTKKQNNTSQPTYNGAKIISGFSGLSESTVQDIWAEVRDNASRLSQCDKPHEFEVIQPTDAERPIDLRYRCVKCGGEIRAHEYRWYLRGVEDQKRREKK